MTSDSATLTAEAHLAADIATFARVLRIRRNFVLCLNGTKLHTLTNLFFQACALDSKGNMPNSHEFVEVSEASDDAVRKSDCE